MLKQCKILLYQSRWYHPIDGGEPCFTEINWYFPKYANRYEHFQWSRLGSEKFHFVSDVYSLTNITNSTATWVNWSLPSAALMRQYVRSALVQIMAWRRIGDRPLSEPIRAVLNWTLRNKLQRNSNQNTKCFIHENAYEKIVCEMVTILSRRDELTLSVSLPEYFRSTFTFTNRE